MEVHVNGRLVDEVAVGGWQQVVTQPFALHSGLNALELRVREGCDKPTEAEGAGDSRCLSIAVQNVTLAP